MVRRSFFTPQRCIAWFVVVVLVSNGGAAWARDGQEMAASGFEAWGRWVTLLSEPLRKWYDQTPAPDRVAWAGMLACLVMTAWISLRKLWELRVGRVMPASYLERFQSRLTEGSLDRIKATDYCELNPSPASRIALAAIRRWGRPAGDLERVVAIEHQRELERLQRHIGTLRRIAGLAPLLGLLGTLAAMQRLASLVGPGSAASAWGSVIGQSLSPVIAGVTLAIVALVAYDAFTARLEALAGGLDRLGAEVVDAIVMAAPVERRPREERRDAPAGHRPHGLGRASRELPPRRGPRGADPERKG
jgi:biopolymer transport protein ExbB